MNTTRRMDFVQYNNIFSRLINATKYSLAGLYYAVKNEQAFRYEIFVLFIICIALVFLPLNVNVERKIFLIFSWLVVLCLELINSAVERAFNLIDENFRPEIKAGKDMLSTAVFIMVCFNIFTWLFLLINL